MTVVTRRVPAEVVKPLRNQVLRPEHRDAEWDMDANSSCVHVGAFDAGTVIGCASVFPSPYDGELLAWQLRGMAVNSAQQGRGIGRLVLDEVVAVVREGGGPLLWANARIVALGFYEQLGWAAHGEVFPHGPAQLPHRIITLRL